MATIRATCKHGCTDECVECLLEEHDAALRLAYARAATAEQRAEKLSEELEQVKHLLTCESIKAERAENRAEAAEARIKEAEGLVAYEVMEGLATKGVLVRSRPTDEECSEYELSVKPLYTRPIPPADVAELQKKLDEAERAIECIIAAHKIEKAAYEHRIGEQERKLAEQQALKWGRTLIGWVRQFDFIPLPEQAEVGDIPVFIFSEEEAEELNALLAKARAEAVPEGWQLVPKELTTAIIEAMVACEGGSMTIQEAWDALLSAAAESEVK